MGPVWVEKGRVGQVVQESILSSRLRIASRKRRAASASADVVAVGRTFTPSAAIRRDGGLVCQGGVGGDTSRQGVWADAQHQRGAGVASGLQ